MSFSYVYEVSCCLVLALSFTFTSILRCVHLFQKEISESENLTEDHVAEICRCHYSV